MSRDKETKGHYTSIEKLYSNDNPLSYHNANKLIQCLLLPVKTNEAPSNKHSLRTKIT